MGRIHLKTIKIPMKSLRCFLNYGSVVWGWVLCFVIMHHGWMMDAKIIRGEKEE